MSQQFETLPWTLAAWLWGIMGVFAAIFYLIGWYFRFALPLILLVFVLAIGVSFFASSFDTSLQIALFISSPLSVWFVTWQFFYFVGPVYTDIRRSTGFFLQRAQNLTPMSAIAMMRQRRMQATRQWSGFTNWLSSRFRRD
ncbi:MAG: hypothetical protein ABJN14_04680 [Paracoccaceae bacterium]